jgi:hypothetical protein
MDRLFHSIFLLVAALVLTACTKEEPAHPCTHQQQAGGDAKAMTTAAQSASMPYTAPGPGGRHHGDAIGDDGDDLSGTERANRKRVP